MDALVRVAGAVGDETAAVVDVVADALGDAPAVVLFFGSSRHDAQEVARRLSARFPEALTAGCTTMGELGPLGATKGGLSAMALGAPARAAGQLVDLATFRYEDGAQLVGALADRLGIGAPDPARHCLVTLTDGLSGMEDILVASLAAGAPGVPLVGGSAGDDFRFQRTWAAVGGEARTRAAAVVLLEPGVPFVAFHLHHFAPTDERVVVTAATPERRLVEELDGWPAAVRLAQILDVPPAALRERPEQTLNRRPASFALQVGDSFFLRSVMTVQGDALLMGGAVEPGTVLRVMAAGDLVGETERGVAGALGRLGAPPRGMIAFSCGGRMLEAELQGVVDAMTRAMTPCPVAGFTTYGEQYGPMQINHSLTGLLLGAPDV